MLQGNVGVYAVAAVIYEATNEEGKKEEQLEKIRDIIKNRRYTSHWN